MILDRVDAEAHQFDIPLVEFRLHVRQSAQLGRADRREVLRVREQQAPAIAQPFVKADRAFSGLGLKVGGDVANF